MLSINQISGCPCMMISIFEIINIVNAFKKGKKRSSNVLIVSKGFCDPFDSTLTMLGTNQMATTCFFRFGTAD